MGKGTNGVYTNYGRTRYRRKFSGAHSKYKGSDRIQRNTAFHATYAFNILAGKEFSLDKKNNTLAANIRLGTVGGRYVSSIKVEASRMQNLLVDDGTVAPYSLRPRPYFRMDAKFGYRKNNKKSTMDFGIDLENLTRHKNMFLQSYSVQEGVCPNTSKAFFRCLTCGLLFSHSVTSTDRNRIQARKEYITKTF